MSERKNKKKIVVIYVIVMAMNIQKKETIMAKPIKMKLVNFDFSQLKGFVQQMRIVKDETFG